MRIGYFGSSKVSIYVLEELMKAGLVPAFVVTTPDKPQGRGLMMTPNVLKSFALEKGLKVYDPAKLDSAFQETLQKEVCDVFIVASYGKIMPKSVVFMPKHKTLNVHPSLLPRYRGAAPLPTAMLEDTKKTGVTIMRLDEKMDEGPMIAVKEITISEWPTYEEFEEMMAREGGKLLAGILSDWVAGKIPEQKQEHSKATYTKKIQKEDAELDLKADPYLNFRKIQAYHEWPQAFFFAERDGKRLRVKATKASFTKGKLNIERVIPEGKAEMAFTDFLERGYELN